MTRNNDSARKLNLTLEIDRKLAWRRGESVRYAVAELRAEGDEQTALAPPLNLALAVDVSGSMAGRKIEAARKTALAVLSALTERDRLTIVAFENRATMLLDGRAMDEAGRKAAASAILRLEAQGGTNVWEGWMLAAERVGVAMASETGASNRILLLSDGQANDGITDAAELARQTRGLLERGIVTSAVGIGDDYDEVVLGSMAEAGGGRLHDAEHAAEISEVVLAEILEGRAALVEGAVLRFTLPANARASVVGGWISNAAPGALEVLVGPLMKDRPVRIVFRINCGSGEPNTRILLSASARGRCNGGAHEIEAGPVNATITLVSGTENNAQSRDPATALAVLTAWQADAISRVTAMNRSGDRRGGKHYLERELRHLEKYARGLAGADAIVAELVLLLRRADEQFNPRMAKELHMASYQRRSGRDDARAAPRMSLAERLRLEKS